MRRIAPLSRALAGLAWAFICLGFFWHPYSSSVPGRSAWLWAHQVFLAALILGGCLVVFAAALTSRLRRAVAIAVAIGVLVPVSFAVLTVEATAAGALDRYPRTPGIGNEPGVRRVLVLGQSLRLRPGNDAPHRFEQAYRADAGGRLVVLDASRPWQTVQQTATSWQATREWAPDTVFLMIGLADLCRQFRRPGEPGPVDVRWRTLLQPSLPGGAPTGVAALIQQRLRLDTWYGSIRSQEVDVPWVEYTNLRPAVASLLELIADIQAAGRRVIVMTQPSLYAARLGAEGESVLWLGRSACQRQSARYLYEHASAQSLGRAMRLLNHEVRGAASRTGAGLVDLDRRIAATTALFETEIHLSDAAIPQAVAFMGEGIGSHAQ